jgi:hypothetical protein
MRWRPFVGVTVTIVWAALYVRSLIDPHFEPSNNVSSVMLVIVAWLFATDVYRRRNRNGNGK